MNNSKKAIGRKWLEKLHGKHSGQQLVDDLKDVCPEFVDMVLEWSFAEIMTRTQIDIKTRELVIIASCVSQGLLPQTKAHIEAALALGVSKAEICEVILQMVIYAGMPHASNAFHIAKEVFAQEK